MTASNDIQVEVRVTRYNVARFRLGQAFIPIALILTVFARRFPETVWIGGAFIAQGMAALAFISAVRRFGWQPLRFERGAVWFGATGLSAPRHMVSEWTWVSGVARIYCRNVSFKLRARRGGEVALEVLLRRSLGKETRLKRRGSNRARLIALVVALAGGVAVVMSFYADALVLTLIGTPAFVIGLATLGALSQRVRA